MWEVRLDYRLIELIGWVSSLSNKNPKLILNNRLVGMLFFGGGGCTCSMWKFRGQGGIELCHSNDPSCCSDNAGSLTHYTTRELQACFFFKPTSTLNSAQRSSRCPSSAWEMWHFPRRCDKGIRSAAGTLLPNLTGERMVLPSSFRDDGRQTSLRWAEQRIN